MSCTCSDWRGGIIGFCARYMEEDTRRMIAYSSVAQIGYIYMGIGLGTQAGMVAAVFHMFTHSATKPFCSQRSGIV